MKKLIAICALVGLAACGAEGDPLQPNVGLGVGIGPGGLKVRPRVTVSDGTGRVTASPSGVSAGASAGPVSVNTGL